MASWHKIKFFFDTMLGSTGSTLSATSTASGYDVANLYNMLETNMWKAANTTDPHYITYDAGAGNTKSADYLAILGHNLFTAGASVVLQSSSDNFAADVIPVVAERVSADTVLLSEARVLVNGNFEVWSAGTAADPDGWTVAGAGAAVARDAVNFKDGLYGAAVTYGSASCELKQVVANPAYFGGRTLTFGCWVKTSIAGNVRLQMYDDSGYGASANHSGGGGWEWLTVTRTIGASPTYVWVKFIVAAAGTAYFDGAALKEGASLASTDVSDFIQPLSNAKRYWRMKLLKATLLHNGEFNDWSNGPSAAPDGWVVSGLTVARESTNYKNAPYGAALTYSGNPFSFYTTVPHASFKGRQITFGIWVKTTNAGVRLSIYDGIAETFSAYHTGGGGWEFLTVSATVSNTATQLAFYIYVGSGAVAYVDSAIAVQGNLTDVWYAALAIWGSKTELDYATASFDPYEQDVKGSVNLSQGGYVTGVHTDYTERSLSLRFEDADTALYSKVKDWWDRNGLKSFFVAYDTANDPTAVYLMRPDPKFSNPLKNGGLYRDITLNLKGRKE